MARPQKVGLDYFPLDVDIDQDDKVAIIEAQHGMIGFSIIIKLLMKIYSEGYYYDWTEKEQILFSKRVNVDINNVNVIINDCVKWGLFDENTFKEHKILTSKGIQLRYFEAVKRRQRVEIAKEFLLLDDETAKSYSNLIIVSINEDEEENQKDNVDINSEDEEVNVDINPQSKVKKSKVKNSKVKNSKSKEKEVVIVDEKNLDSISDDRDSGINTAIENEEYPLYDRDLQSVSIIFEQSGFGTVNITVKEILVDFIEEYSAEWVIEALKIATSANKRSLNYVRGILENFKRDGGINKGNRYQSKPITSQTKKTRFHNFEGRTENYTADEINKKVEDMAERKKREYLENLKKNRGQTPTIE